MLATFPHLSLPFRNTNPVFIFSALVTLLWPDLSIHMVPNLTVVQPQIFQLCSGAKAMCAQQKPHFEFWSFPRQAICGPILSCVAGQWPRAVAPGRPHHHKSQQPIHLQPLHTHASILFLTLDIVFNKLLKIFSTCYKICFAIDEFAQLVF